MQTLTIGVTGSNVKLVQSLISRLGYNPGEIDGIYGRQTAYAVSKFQNDYGLTSDGIVHIKTWEVFNTYLRGYDEYIIQPEDTLYLIAQRYNTSVNAIMTANHYLDLYNLRISQEIIIPYGIDVVFTDIDYTFDIMERDILGLKVRYPFLEVGLIGRSVLGKNLYYIRIGNGPKEVFYNGAHHSLEWITTVVLMKYVEDFSKAYAQESSLEGYNLDTIFNETSIFIVPMVNPDGVDLVLNGLDENNPYYNELIQWNDTGLPFSQVWQANIRGVDLNRNYPASWQAGKAQEISLGVYGPGPTRYGGPYPLSEPESQAIAEFTRGHNFTLVIAYHSQGRVIFWRYLDMDPPKALEIGKEFSRLTGYQLSEVYPEAAFAGFKDWFIQTYNRPGYTIEVGLGKNPLPIEQFNRIYNNNLEVLLLAAII